MVRAGGARSAETLEQVTVTSREAWRAWLEANHGQRASIWLVTYKKDASPSHGAHVPYDAIIDTAKANGSWSRLDAVEALTIPDDLAAALARHGSAGRFDAFPRSVTRGILEWILQAKRPETRGARVEETARLAAQGVRANQLRQVKTRE